MICGDDFLFFMFSVVEKYYDWKVKSSIWGRERCNNIENISAF